MGNDNVQPCFLRGQRAGGLLAEQPQQGALGNEAADDERSVAPPLWDERGRPQRLTTAKQ